METCECCGEEIPPFCVGCPCCGLERPPLNSVTDAAVARAVAAERERCAKVCDGLADRWQNSMYAHAARLCAAAIRKGDKPVDTGVKPSELAARS